MTALRVLISRLRARLTRRRDDAALREEFETHLALLEDDYRRQGLSDAEARAAARRSFGGVEQTRLDWTRQRRLPLLDATVQDIRFAGRRLLAERRTTAVAVGILALGVGSTVVMADMLDRLLLRAPPHVAESDRVRRVYTYVDRARPHALITFYATIEHLERGLASEVSHVAALMREEIGFGRGPEASRFRAVTHSRCYFDVLGLTAHRGTLPSCSRPHQPDTVVLAHGVWQQHFGGRIDILGRAMRLGMRTYTVVAVTPPGFTGVDTEPADVWLPLESRADDGAIMDGWRTEASYAMLQVLVRLRPGVDVRTAEASATTVYNAGPTLVRWADGKTRTSYVRLGELAPARQPGGTDEVRVSLGIGAVSAFVLLIACGNVGNLLFVRGLRRGRELAVKTALGATRGRLFRELIVEGGLLAVLGSVAALAFVHWGGAAVRAVLLPEGAMAGTGIDMRLIALTTTVCAAATLALGLFPALRLIACASLSPGRSLARERPSLLLDAYVALQVALSVPLLAGAAVFGLSLWHARQVDFGMTTSHVAVVSTNMGEVGEVDRNHRTHREIESRLTRLPQVMAVSAVQTVPLRGGFAHIYEIPGVKRASGIVSTLVNAVDPSFFTVMGIPIVSGRGFSEQENSSTGPRATIISQSMARRYWPNTSPIGRCIRIGTGNDPCVEIVGVAADSSLWLTLAAPLADASIYYVPIERYGHINSNRALILRTSDSPSRLIDLLRRQAATAAPDLPHIQVYAFDDIFLPALRPLRLGSTVFALFALMALVIAGAGLAAVTASSVARRTRELGIRLALGADPARLVRMVFRRSLAATIVGLAAGAALAIAGERSLRSVLYGVREGDMRPIIAAAAVLVIIAAVAAWVPARRAGQVDPAIALRTD
jgi:predicted permease